MRTGSPFAGPDGELARRNLLRMVAATGDGPGPDFAREILAGTRQPAELLVHGPVIEEMVEQFRGYRTLLDKLPRDQLAAMADRARDEIRQDITELAELDIDAAEAELHASPGIPPEVAAPQSPAAPAVDHDTWFDQPIMG